MTKREGSIDELIRVIAAPCVARCSIYVDIVMKICGEKRTRDMLQAWQAENSHLRQC